MREEFPTVAARIDAAVAERMSGLVDGNGG